MVVIEFDGIIISIKMIMGGRGSNDAAAGSLDLADAGDLGRGGLGGGGGDWVAPAGEDVFEG